MKIKGSRVALFGLGVSGRSALRYTLAEGAELTAIAPGPVDHWPSDLHPLLSRVHCLPQEEKSLSRHLAKQDLILLSPGIPRQHPLLKDVLEKGIPVWSEVELAYKSFPHPIVAVTGTNGKTTTATMLAQALELAGIKTFLGGNIGRPFLDYFLDGEKAELAILELSSFQLESLSSFRPQVAIILNIIPQGHGERYPKASDYARAKRQIARNMGAGDTLLLGPVGELANSPWPPEITVLNLPPPSTVDRELQAFLPMSRFQLAGSHNRHNLWFVYQALKSLGKNLAGLPQMVREFSGLPHRLERLTEGPPISIFNDAKSTNWQATLTALKALKEEGRENIWPICGGQLRGRHDQPHPHEIAELENTVGKVLAIGESAPLIARYFSRVEVFPGLVEAWEYMKKELTTGTILFSPAFPSFDQYRNYIERGEHFKKLATDFNKSNE